MSEPTMILTYEFDVECYAYSIEPESPEIDLVLAWKHANRKSREFLIQNIYHDHNTEFNGNYEIRYRGTRLKFTRKGETNLFIHKFSLYVEG